MNRIPLDHNAMTLGFPDYAAQARALAAALELSYDDLQVHRFPDGESRLCLPAALPQQVLIYCSLDNPNTRLIELLLATATARDLGAERCVLIAPYLCYMRQDIAFHPGEAVSQRIVGRWLADHFDAVITIDPHLHRISRLEQAIPTQFALSLSAAPLLGRYAATHFDAPLLLGPDAESAQWVQTAAAAGQLDYAVARKRRHDDRNVEIELPELDLHDRCVVLLDDIASTGRTLARAAEALYARGAADVHALVTHPLFVGDAEAQLQAAGIRTVHSTTSINHSSNTLPLTDLLATAFAR